jgi:hypothetical protein
MTDLNFDFSQVNPIFEGGSFLPVSDAKGWLVILTEDQGWKQSTKNQNNWYLQLAGKGQEGVVAGKDFVLRFNLKNDKPSAVNSASQELSALGTVLGLPGRIGNTAELFNKPFRLVSEQQVGDDGKPTAFTQLATNGIRDVNGNMAGKAGAGPQVAQPAPQAPSQGQFPPQGQPAPFQPQGQPQGQPPFSQGVPQGQPQGGAPFQPPQGQPPFVPQGQPFQPQPAPFGAPQGQPGPGGTPGWAQQPGR